MNEQKTRWSMEVNWTALGLAAMIIIGIALAALLIFRAFWVTDTENYTLTFTFDRVNGQIETVDQNGGWVIRTPLRYNVHQIDLRPNQLMISANQRVLNAKLVRFNPKGLKTFVEWHGQDAGDNVENLKEILKCYAFAIDGGKDCPFLTVIQDIAPNQGAQSREAVEAKR